MPPMSCQLTPVVDVGVGVGVGVGVSVGVDAGVGVGDAGLIETGAP